MAASKHLFRRRGATFHVNEADLELAALYLRKPASQRSRWGMELTLQAGSDSEVFGYSASAPNLAGSDWLRHLGPTTVSVLARAGEGLTLQAGIFGSFIGYDSLYAKDNLNYTRPWGADFTPYLMMGLNAQYPFTERLTGTAFLINRYWHLAHANDAPTSGCQLAYKATGQVTLKETLLYGPHQADTAIDLWRFLSDSIAEWKGDRLIVAFEYFVGTEKLAAPASARALWMAAQLPFHLALTHGFSLTIRPEVYWDRDARTTGFQQLVKANTTKLEYRIPFREASAILRLEHRIDDSRGAGGGFFTGGELAPGVVGLTPTQNLVTLGAILTFDSNFNL